MKIIPDTNIWYHLGENKSILQQVTGQPIAPTFINLRELTFTGALVERETNAREAIRAMLEFKNNMIFDSPYVHLAKLFSNYQYDSQKACEHDVAVALRFANGGSVAGEHRDAFHRIMEGKQKTFQAFADFSNAQLYRIREQIATNRRNHLKEESLQLTADFINLLVAQSTNNETDLVNCDLNQCELLIRTVDHFFKRMETTEMSFKGNDLYDFSLLAYVQPGDKFWTREKRWIGLITDAGMGEYLFPGL